MKYLINTYLNDRTRQQVIEVWPGDMAIVDPPYQGTYDRKYIAPGSNDFAYMVKGQQVFDTWEEAFAALTTSPPRIEMTEDQRVKLAEIQAMLDGASLKVSELWREVEGNRPKQNQLAVLKNGIEMAKVQCRAVRLP